MSGTGYAGSSPTTQRDIVSVHALHRYMERALGIDVEAIRREIRRKVEEAVITGATGHQIDGVLFVIRDGVVVTTAPSKPKCRKASAAKVRHRLRFEESRRCR
jgi:hypothetical protein